MGSTTTRCRPREDADAPRLDNRSSRAEPREGCHTRLHPRDRVLFPPVRTVRLVQAHGGDETKESNPYRLQEVGFDSVTSVGIGSGGTGAVVPLLSPGDDVPSPDNVSADAVEPERRVPKRSSEGKIYNLSVRLRRRPEGGLGPWGDRFDVSDTEGDAMSDSKRGEREPRRSPGPTRVRSTSASSGRAQSVG